MPDLLRDGREATFPLPHTRRRPRDDAISRCAPQPLPSLLLRPGSPALDLIPPRAPQGRAGKTLGVGQDVDLDDLPARDREPEDRGRPSTRRRNDSRRSVHECRSGERAKPPREGERLLGHGRRAPDHPRCARGHGADVGSEHHVGVERREQGVEVTAAGGGQEGVDAGSLAGEIRRGPGRHP